MRWLEDLLTVGGTLVMILLIFVGAYFATRFLGKKYSYRRGGGSSGKIRMVDQLPLGPDRLVVIVQTGGKTLLLGVTSQHVELLEELDSSLFPQEEEPGDSGETFSFSSALQDALSSWKANDHTGRKGGPRL